MNVRRIRHIAADILTDLAAGWIGAAIIIPGLAPGDPRTVTTLLAAIVLVILAVVMAYFLRE